MFTLSFWMAKEYRTFLFILIYVKSKWFELKELTWNAQANGQRRGTSAAKLCTILYIMLSVTVFVLSIIMTWFNVSVFCFSANLGITGWLSMHLIHSLHCICHSFSKRSQDMKLWVWNLVKIVTKFEFFFLKRKLQPWLTCEAVLVIKILFD